MTLKSAAAPALDLDAILAQVGQFGRYQVLNYCLILLPIAFSAVYNAQYIFNAADVRYRCAVPECESAPPQWAPGPWADWALPAGDAARCTRHPPSSANASCLAAHFDLGRTERCDSWLYADHNSIVAEFDLACQEWKRTLVGTVHSAGLLAALPLTGYVSDAFGRRTAFVATAVCAGAMGLARSFSTTYVTYMLFEFLDAMLGSGVYSTGFILALEMVGLQRRVLGGNIISSTYALGQVALALTARWLPHWRTLTRALYAPSLLFLAYYFVLAESVRWLLSKGRRAEAATVIRRVAALNGRTLSKEVLQQLEDSDAPEKPPPPSMVETAAATGAPRTRSLAAQVLRSRILMSRLCICSFWWITTTFIYYGLSINSVSLAGDMYWNYMLTSLVEVPGYALSVLTLDRFGRKRSIATALSVCSAALVALPFVPAALHWAGPLLTMVGKLCISMTFSSIYIYTSELFPTSARHSLLGACSMVGRVGSLLAPQTPLLMAYMASLPYLLFGVMAGCSAALMLLTPETLRVTLPDTVQQAEGLAASRTAPPAPPAPPSNATPAPTV